MINKFKGSGIRLDTNGGDVVEGNYLGTDTTGTVSKDFGNQHDGVESDAPFTTIGGTDPGARNIISGNLGNGVSIGPDAFLIPGRGQHHRPRRERHEIREQFR